jgi:hypothetical protein
MAMINQVNEIQNLPFDNQNSMVKQIINKGQHRAKCNTIAACQQGKDEQEYILKNKGRHTIKYWTQ